MHIAYKSGISARNAHIEHCCTRTHHVGGDDSRNASSRNDDVGTAGVIGKIVRVEDAEVGLEIATGVTVKVKKSMISEVQARGTPAPANDAKV